MARKTLTPLTFFLPDGDRVDLCTWDYIESILEIKLSPMIDAIKKENIDLQNIDNKLSEWISDSDD